MSSLDALYQKHIHLIGIGGTGLSAIAQVLLERGCRVSGSDRQESPFLERLIRLGAEVYIGHSAENIEGVDLVVTSSAVPADNPEVIAARVRGIPVLKRADFIGQMMVNHYCIAVAGTHGKTTTTALIAFILTEAGLSPSFIIGGVSRNLGTNARAGQSDFFVIEADEYDRMFWGLNPHLAVVTSIEMDHPDCFGSIEEMAQAFKGFLQRVSPDGCVVANGDDGRVKSVLREVVVQKIETYGLSGGLDWQAKDIAANERGGHTFSVWHNDASLGPFDLQVPGVHNVLNALAAIAAVTQVGVGLDTIRDSLLRFEGTERRFEHKGTAAGVTVIDDYAHHPTEVRATLAAARARYPGRPVWAVFQPHTYSRFKALLQEFAGSFEAADHVIVTDVFAARERDSLGVRAVDLVELMNHPDVRYIPGLDEVMDFLAKQLRPGDVVITLGAGTCYQVGDEILTRLGAG